jgi:hypothetical protein
MTMPTADGRTTLGIYGVLIAAVAFFAWSTANTSQPSVSSGRERESSPPNEHARTNQTEPSPLIGTEANPAVVRITKSPEETAHEQDDRVERTAANWWTIGLTGALVAGTLGLIWIGRLQWQTYVATLTTNKTIERAYLSIGPTASSEWVNWPSIEPAIRVVVRNHGHTPARVTDLVPGLYLHERAALPDHPDLLDLKPITERREAYLLHGQHFGVTCNFGRLPDAAWHRWRYDTGLTMWLVIYADYVTFGERRRRGVAYFIERFDQDQFEYEPKLRYNYDRKREPGEGRDWDEPAE